MTTSDNCLAHCDQPQPQFHSRPAGDPAVRRRTAQLGVLSLGWGLLTLVGIVVVLAYLQVTLRAPGQPDTALRRWVQGRVVSRLALGPLLNLSAMGGLPRSTMVETQTGFYPVEGTVSASRGVPMRLLITDKGQRYLCDAQEQLCLRTESEQVWVGGDSGSSSAP